MKALTLTLALLVATPGIAQQLSLGELHDAARAADPRLRQLELEAEQSALRLRDLDTARRPSILVEAQAQYQSDVVEFPFRPSSGDVPSPPKDTYDASIRIEQTILDPTLHARVDAERARHAETLARVETALFPLRQQVNDAFFAAASLQERIARIQTAITALEARLRETTIRVNEGVALPGDAATIEAALLAARQEQIQLRAQHQGALSRLAELTGRTLTADQKLAIPDHSTAVATALAQIATLRARPEYEQFVRARDRLETQIEIAGAQDDPRVVAYGRAGYGKPGLNFLSNSFDAYFLGGIRLQWKPWDWGVADREQRQLTLQQESIAADEASFRRTLAQSIQNDLAAIGRLDEVLALDARIVELRELIERETRARYDERAVTAAELVDKTTDVLEARILRAVHEIELAQARARLLTILGLEAR